MKVDNKLNIKIFTLFPEAFPGTLAISVIGNAFKNGLCAIETINIRDFANDKHHSVDDAPFGGGAGMVMKADVVDAALRHVYSSPENIKEQDIDLIYMSPRGVTFDQDQASSMSTKANLGIICGRFEGIDQRVIQKWNIKEISIGDYILAGGEVAALAMLESIIRLKPGVLGCDQSTQEESFNSNLLEYDQYTKPRQWEGMDVPEILLSGNHEEIRKWRRKSAENLTKTRRPDLWAKYTG